MATPRQLETYKLARGCQLEAVAGLFKTGTFVASFVGLTPLRDEVGDKLCDQGPGCRLLQLPLAERRSCNLKLSTYNLQ
jgi:hypothetical protein